LELRDSLRDLQAGADRPHGVILVSMRPAEVDHQPIAQILSNVAFITLDDSATSALIRLHQIAQLFRVEPGGELGRANQIAEHDGELPTLRVLNEARLL